jgi:large subunit ribosomal protein L35e
MGHLKPYELLAKKREELFDQLAGLEKKLFELRGQAATSSSRQKLHEIRSIRKDIARVKGTLMKQQRQALQAKYARKKLIPKDILPHTVKSVRKQLAPKFGNKLTQRAARRAKFLKPVKFALKA